MGPIASPTSGLSPSKPAPPPTRVDSLLPTDEAPDQDDLRPAPLRLSQKSSGSIEPRPASGSRIELPSEPSTPKSGPSGTSQRAPGLECHSHKASITTRRTTAPRLAALVSKFETLDAVSNMVPGLGKAANHALGDVQSPPGESVAMPLETTKQMSHKSGDLAPGPKSIEASVRGPSSASSPISPRQLTPRRTQAHGNQQQKSLQHDDTPVNGKAANPDSNIRQTSGARGRRSATKLRNDVEGTGPGTENPGPRREAGSLPWSLVMERRTTFETESKAAVPKLPSGLAASQPSANPFTGMRQPVKRLPRSRTWHKNSESESTDPKLRPAVGKPMGNSGCSPVACESHATEAKCVRQGVCQVGTPKKTKHRVADLCKSFETCCGAVQSVKRLHSPSDPSPTSVRGRREQAQEPLEEVPGEPSESRADMKSGNNRIPARKPLASSVAKSRSNEQTEVKEMTDPGVSSSIAKQTTAEDGKIAPTASGWLHTLPWGSQSRYHKSQGDQGMAASSKERVLDRSNTMGRDGASSPKTKDRNYLTSKGQPAVSDLRKLFDDWSTAVHKPRVKPNFWNLPSRVARSRLRSRTTSSPSLESLETEGHGHSAGRQSAINQRKPQPEWCRAILPSWTKPGYPRAQDTLNQAKESQPNSVFREPYGEKEYDVNGNDEDTVFGGSINQAAWRCPPYNDRWAPSSSISNGAKKPVRAGWEASAAHEPAQEGTTTSFGRRKGSRSLRDKASSWLRGKGINKRDQEPLSSMNEKIQTAGLSAPSGLSISFPDDRRYMDEDEPCDDDTGHLCTPVVGRTASPQGTPSETQSIASGWHREAPGWAGCLSPQGPYHGPLIAKANCGMHHPQPKQVVRFHEMRRIVSTARDKMTI